MALLGGKGHRGLKRKIVPEKIRKELAEGGKGGGRGLPRVMSKAGAD